MFFRKKYESCIPRLKDLAYILTRESLDITLHREMVDAGKVKKTHELITREKNKIK